MTAADFDRNVVLGNAKIAALWSTSGPEDAEYEMLDAVFTEEDITGEAEEQLIALIDDFFEKAGDLLDEYPSEAEQLGHDIIMTANHHGVGFWDRGLGELGVKLTAVCDTLGEYELYVGDDGKLYV